MKFDSPTTTNAIDAMRIVGRPFDRIEGPLKVTGRATYAYEWHHEQLNPVYGFVLGAGIAKGTIGSLDLRAAKKAPGVLTIVTADNAGTLGKGERNTARLLGGPGIEHYHQAIALVVAETFEQARAAAGLIKIEYKPTPGSYDLAREKTELTGEPDVVIGEFNRSFAAAPVKLDETYSTPDQSHAMMEPHATIAVWIGDELTVWTSNQMILVMKRGPATSREEAPRKRPINRGCFMRVPTA
jgi:xanthine dehydrogenase YagR molybdenum-binding subunit